jgi:hypothetical protein
MATIDQVKKQYNKMTARERFALVHAASVKDDRAARAEIMSASPRKRWAMPDYYGLSEGFQFAATWYMMQQLGHLATLYWMFENSHELDQVKPSANMKTKPRVFEVMHQGETYNIDLDDMAGKTIKRVLSNLAGWVRVCKEYNVDAYAMLRHYPHYDVLQMMIGILDSAAGLMGGDGPPSEEEIDAAAENIRGVIQQYEKDWE